jgi:hypothetical protein
MSSSTTAPSIAPNKSPQAILDELPSVFATETRLKHNPYTTNNINSNFMGHQDSCNSGGGGGGLNTSQPSSPPESVCSRMSDTSIPSLIRQDINLNKNKLQNILKATNQQQQQQHQNYSINMTQQAPPSDFKALFSKLSTNKTIQQSPTQLNHYHQYQSHQLTDQYQVKFYENIK